MDRARCGMCRLGVGGYCSMGYYIMHLDSDLRGEIKALRKDMNRCFEAVDKRFASTQWLIGTGIALLAMMIAFFQFF